MNSTVLRVAIPWSLSHYIALNGFHPIYRALFDHAPEWIELQAWDNVKLFELFRRDEGIRSAVNDAAEERDVKIKRIPRLSVKRRWQEYFWPPNQVLTTALEGDLEFHHTAPFPSLRRPFILHCESFAPVFFPFTRQGNGSFKNTKALRKYYGDLFRNPMCLGIFSHVPETIENLRRFFLDDQINGKLFQSRIGLSSNSLVTSAPVEKTGLSRPKFLFMNSAHQNPGSFFLRGGHIVLRFWKNYIESGHDGLLIMRCAKPEDDDLADYGVDPAFLNAQKRRSLFWTEDYLPDHEMNALMASAHFFLLPGLSLHSASIVHAMVSGAIPVVTDTPGNDLYVTDDEDGIVLKGVREAIWREDPNMGILVDRCHRSPELDSSLVRQLTHRISAVLEKPDHYRKMSERTFQRSIHQFSGEAFSDHFWELVRSVYFNFKKSSSYVCAPPGVPGIDLSDCILEKDSWERVFKGPTQPVRRIYSGESTVWELSGTFLHALGNPVMAKTDWSVFAYYFKQNAPLLIFAKHLDDLNGRYLSSSVSPEMKINSKMPGRISQWMTRFPKTRAFSFKVLKSYRAQLKFLRQYGRFLTFKLIRGKGSPDLEVISNAFWGFHIVRCFHKYYAIARIESPFNLAKVQSGGYSLCFSAFSIPKLVRKISKAADRNVSMKEMVMDHPDHEED